MPELVINNELLSLDKGGEADQPQDSGSTDALNRPEDAAMPFVGRC